MNTDKHESDALANRQRVDCRRRNCLLLVACLLAVVGVFGVITALSKDRQPKYDGKSLDYWCEKLIFDYPTNASATKAVRAIGTNALAYLLEQIRAFDAKHDTISGANKLVARQELVEIQIQQGMHKWQKACWGFGALGEVASNAIPELESLLVEKPQAIHALLMIGDPATPAILRTQTNRQFWSEHHVAAGISFAASYGHFSSDNLLLFFPSLRSLAQSSNQFTALEALAALRNLSNLVAQANGHLQNTSAPERDKL